MKPKKYGAVIPISAEVIDHNGHRGQLVKRRPTLRERFAHWRALRLVAKVQRNRHIYVDHDGSFHVEPPRTVDWVPAPVTDEEAFQPVQSPRFRPDVW